MAFSFTLNEQNTFWSPMWNSEDKLIIEKVCRIDIEGAEAVRTVQRKP